MLATQFEVLSKIHFSYMLIISKLRCSALFEDMSFKKEVSSVGYRKSLMDIMIGDKYSNIFFPEFRDYFLDIYKQW